MKDLNIKGENLNLIKNKYLFFLLRVWRDITNPTQWPLSEDLHSRQLGEFYFLFSEETVKNQKGGQKSIVFDDEGIPMNPTYIDVKDKDFVYYPITIGQVGLAVYHTWLKSNSDSDKNRFMRFVNWFMKNVEEDPTLGAYWETDVPLPQYKNPGPWKSAFAQARAISILLRGYQMTGDNRYAELARKALKSFTIPFDQGGVMAMTEHGPFYEEYTAEIPTLVLNGMIFTLCGIYDFVRVFPEDQTAKTLFDDGIRTLRSLLPDYDLGYWSRYNLCKSDWYPETDPSTITYQHFHAFQLELLSQITGDEVFKLYSRKFRKQINIINILRMYYQKYKALKKLNRL